MSTTPDLKKKPSRQSWYQWILVHNQVWFGIWKGFPRDYIAPTPTRIL